MAPLTRQVAAWKASWRRLESANEEIKIRFLQTIGECLGERDAQEAICVGRRIVTSSCSADREGSCSPGRQCALPGA